MPQSSRPALSQSSQPPLPQSSQQPLPQSSRPAWPQIRSENNKPAPRPPPLRPGNKEFVSGLKRLRSVTPNRTVLKKQKTDDLVHAAYRENYANFLTYLTKDKEINYKMKRGRG